jgi:hypothetical protein
MPAVVRLPFCDHNLGPDAQFFAVPLFFHHFFALFDVRTFAQGKGQLAVTQVNGGRAAALDQVRSYSATLSLRRLIHNELTSRMLIIKSRNTPTPLEKIVKDAVSYPLSAVS